MPTWRPSWRGSTAARRAGTAPSPHRPSPMAGCSATRPQSAMEVRDYVVPVGGPDINTDAVDAEPAARRLGPAQVRANPRSCTTSHSVDAEGTASHRSLASSPGKQYALNGTAGKLAQGSTLSLLDVHTTPTASRPATARRSACSDLRECDQLHSGWWPPRTIAATTCPAIRFPTTRGDAVRRTAAN